MRGDKTVLSDRGRDKRTWEAMLLNASEEEAMQSVWRFKKANKSVRFWWEPTRKGAA